MPASRLLVGALFVLSGLAIGTSKMDSLYRIGGIVLMLVGGWILAQGRNRPTKATLRLVDLIVVIAFLVLGLLIFVSLR